MLVHDRFVYIQMQKTGCTRIAQILQELTGAVHERRKHDYLDSKPADKLVIGSIRDPWAWYVSLWVWRGLDKNPICPALARSDPRYGQYYTDLFDPTLFRAWLTEIHNGDNAADLPGGYGRFPLRHQVGFMSWRYAYLYQAGMDYGRSPAFADYAEFEEYDRRHNMVDGWIRTEDMPRTLRPVLAQVGYDVSPDRLHELCQTRMNETEHLPYMEYYNAASYRLVEERERLIVGKHYCHIVLLTRAMLSQRQ